MEDGDGFMQNLGKEGWIGDEIRTSGVLILKKIWLSMSGSEYMQLSGSYGSTGIFRSCDRQRENTLGVFPVPSSILSV